MPPAKEPIAKRKPRKVPPSPAQPGNGVGEYAEAARKTPEQIDTGEVSTAVSWMRAGTEKFFQVHQFNPDELVARKGLKTYKKMRHDEQVKAASTAKKQAAISTGWEIEEPKIEGGEEIADEMRRFVEFNLGTDAAGGEMAGTMEQKLMEMMTAADFGYSVTEPTLKYIEYGEFEGFIGIKELKTRDPENIDFVTDQYGNLLDDGVTQFGRRLPEGRFAIYSHDKEFDNWYGTSQLRAAYRPWWIKDTLLKFMTMAMERYGEPIAVATTEKKLNSGEQSRLDAMFKNLQNRTLITIPKWVTLEFKVPQQRAGDAYASVMNKLDSWISRAILLPTKMGLSGESETGNYSQASEEFDLFLQIIGFMRRIVAALVNDRIIKSSLIDLNYEVTGGNYPKFKFREITQERKDAIYKLFLDGLSRNALTKVEADENRARSMIGWPELTEEELAEAEAEKQAMRERFEPGQEEEAETAVDEDEEFFPFARDYHLEGEHDQCDHSPTGECVDPEWENKREERGKISSGDRISGNLTREGSSGKHLISQTRWGGNVVLDRDGNEERARRVKKELNSILSEVPDEHLRGLKKIDAAGHGLTFLGSASYIPPSNKKGYVSDEIMLSDKWHDKTDEDKRGALLHEIGHRFQTVVSPTSFKMFKTQGLDKHLESVFDSDWRKEFLPIYRKRGGDAVKAEIFAESYAQYLAGSLKSAELKAFWDKQFKLKKFQRWDLYSKRKPNQYERRVDFEKIDKDLDRLAFDVSADVRKLVRKAESYAINQVKMLIDKGVTASDIRNFKIDTGPEVTARFNQFLMDVYKDGADEAKSELPRSRQRDLIGVRFFQGLEPREALEYFRSKADFDMKGVIDQDLTEKVRRSLLQFMKGGKTMSEEIDQIRRIFEPFVGDPEKIGPSGQVGIGFPPGEFAPENVLMAYRLENIIRTPMIESFNEGRKAIGDAAGDYVIGYNYSAILDTRTTEICRFLDGFRIRKDDPHLASLSPPNHYQCRSLLTFITTDDTPVEFEDEADLDEGVRIVQTGFK